MTDLNLIRVSLGEQSREQFLPLGERALHLAADEECVRDRPEEAEANLVINDIADDGSGNATARLGAKLVAVMPALERALVLNVSEIMIPFEFGDARDPARAQGKEREDAERSHDGGTEGRARSMVRPVRPGA